MPSDPGDGLGRRFAILMAPPAFSRVEELFHAALARAPDERRAFLEEECGGNESLLREVESLLGHEEEARRFLGEPVVDAATRKLSHSRGTRLGRYEIGDLIGRGGMGEVYRARDTVLARDVAIKVLPEGAAGDPARLRRFEHEARAAGALNHPNILDVHDVGTHEGTLYVVTELLEGRTLRERLRAGAIPIPELLSCAEQIADGLVAAHAKGIIHRDLKPGNLFLTRDGRVKILDFGLAKLIPDPHRRSSIRTPTATPLTHLGDVLGTVAYMSPEQARGEELDVRTDLFSLGVVLYEMAAGRHAFTGATSALIFDAILHEVPTSPARLNPAVPAKLEGIINKALEKDRELRYQHASDLRADLKRLKRDSDSGRPIAHEATESRLAVASPRLSTLSAWTKRASGAAALVAVLGAVGWWLLSTRARDVPRPVEITPFTTEGGLKRLPQLSPDGEKVAYMWAGPADDNWDIYVKALGPRTKPIRLTDHPAEDQVPVWSPDGHLIAFRRVTDQGWAIYTVPALGGQERKLTDVGPSPVWGQHQHGPLPGLAWSPDGKWLALAEEPSKDEPVRIVRLDLATLHRQPLTSPPPGTLGDAQLALSPDGRHLAFVRRRYVVDPGELWVQPTDGGEARRLVSADFCSLSPGYFGLAWTPDGSEVIFTAITADRPRMLRVPRAGGVPQPVAGIGREAQFPSIRGRRMVYEGWAWSPREVWRIPGRNAIPGQAPEALIVSSPGDNCPAFSPDDRKIAFASLRGGTTNIFVCDSDGSNPIQLTDLAMETGMPRWSPDGHRIAFDSVAAGESDIYVIGAEGGLPRRLTPEPSVDYNPSWSRDGRWIYFSSDRGGSRQVWKLAAEGGRAIQVTQKGGFDAAESWDGRYIYYSKDFRSGVWRMPVTGGEETAIVSGPLSIKGWALARGGVYFAEATSIGARSRDYAIRYLDLESGQVSELFRKKGPFRYESLSVSSDERWILHVEQPEPRSELMLVENFR